MLDQAIKDIQLNLKKNILKNLWVFYLLGKILVNFVFNNYDKKTLNQTKNCATYVFRSTSKR